jgi:large subunit ribosomal protein L29
MKAQELRDLTIEELEQKNRDLLKQIFDLKMTQTSGQLENPLQLRYLRREIARVKTVVREKQAESKTESSQ